MLLLTVLSDAAEGWGVAAGILTTLALVALTGTLLSLLSLWRLRTDSRTIDAAERLETVNLSRVVKRYVPPQDQTQRAAEEMAIARQAIAAHRPRWLRAAVIACLIMVCSAVPAFYAFQRHHAAVASAPVSETPGLNLDVAQAVPGVWSAVAGAAFVLSLVALGVAAVAVASLWRLRQAWRVMAAAERLEPVNLGAVIRRYVPGELHTQRFMEEIALARNIVTDLRHRRQRMAIAAILVLLLGATATTYSAQRQLKVMATAQLNRQPRVNLDVLQAIQGVWGWRADFLESCSENPQAVSVSSDRKKLMVRYTKPFESETGTMMTDVDFDVVAATPDSIVLSAPAKGSPLRVYVQFVDADTFSLTRSDRPLGSSGTIVRCPLAPQVDPSIAR